MTSLKARFVRIFTVLALVVGVVQMWALSVSAAEMTQPGRCVKVVTQETARDGSTHIRIQRTCEYTKAERAAGKK